MTSAEFQEKNRDYAHTNDRTVVIKELERRAPVRRSVGSRDRPEHRARPLRGRRGRGRAQRARPGDTAIDAGAHIGFFTMQMAAMVGADGAVHAFEPFDANADLLERSIRENRLRAIASSSGEPRSARRRGTATLTFPVETLNTGGAYLLRDGTPPLAGQPDEETCPSSRSTTCRSGGRSASSRWTSKVPSRW